MEVVQSMKVIAIMQPSLQVGVSPVELVHDEILHNHYGALAGKNELHLNVTMPLLLR